MGKKISFVLSSFIMVLFLIYPGRVSAKEKQGVVNSGSGLYVREANSMNSKRIGSLSDKTKVIIVSETKNWYKIKFDSGNKNKFGFVLRKYIHTENSTDEKAKKKAAKEEKKEEKKKKKKKNKIGKKAESGKSEKKSEETEHTVLKNYQSVIVAADLLNVREKNNKKSNIISTVRALETYPILSLTKNWVKIALTSETEGYVMREYVDFSVLEAKDGHEILPNDKTDTEISNDTQEDDSAEYPKPPLLHASDVDFVPLENKVVVLNAAAVNVRRDTNLESPIMAMLLQGARLEATGDSENWIRVSIDDEQGYIMKPYAAIEDGIIIYDTLPEGLHIARTEEEIIKPEGKDGAAIVEFAKQFLGNPYSWGGTSLTNGADCSGFVQSIFKSFGYQLKRTSGQQRHEGISVASLSEAMPGDLICYDGHIGIFGGHGVGLIHASNKKSGIIITKNPSYRPIVAIRRIIYS